MRFCCTLHFRVTPMLQSGRLCSFIFNCICLIQNCCRCSQRSKMPWCVSIPCSSGLLFKNLQNIQSPFGSIDITFCFSRNVCSLFTNNSSSLTRFQRPHQKFYEWDLCFQPNFSTQFILMASFIYLFYLTGFYWYCLYSSVLF